jgi:leader peptidase (prepilin peptidase)/N-methyltransferase
MRLTAIALGVVAGGTLGALLPRVAFRLSVPASAVARAQCPHCQTRFRHGIAGWIATNRQCRSCGAALDDDHWPYAAATALVFGALVCRLRISHPANVFLLAAWLLLGAVGVLLAAIDIHAQRLPATITASTACGVAILITASAVVARQASTLINAATAAMLLGTLYLTLAFATRKAMGMGDVWLSALLGLALGSLGWQAVFLGSLLPYAIALPILVVLRLRKRLHRHSPIPFGPFLIAGALTAAAWTGVGSHS